MATNGNINHPEQYAGPPAATEGGNATPSTSNLSKDEVGWYFVEQYYTTLSKNPEKLHLFYGKKSQFVYGLEAEIADVAVGRQTIQERIKKLHFQDCKVRISNVDSQSSFDNIVIQVLGETSAKSGELKKFAQTFVLAQQPSGYFVLNDILRYIKDEDEEESGATGLQQEAVAMNAPLAPAQELHLEAEIPKSEASVEESPHLDPAIVDKKLEEVGAGTKETPSSSAAATPAEPVSAPQDSTAKSEATAENLLSPETAAREVAEEEVKQPEVPKDPTPTPVVTRTPAPAAAAASPAPAEPEKPKEPPQKRTWANLVATNTSKPVPVMPAMPKTATPPVAQNRQTAPTPAASQAAAPAQAAEATTPKETASEWQTAGGDSKRQNRPQSVSGPPQKEDGVLGYVKFVTEKVADKDLRAHLASFGDIVYFDVNRSKNCAFVEFSTPTSFQAAMAAKHIVNGENLVLEHRRPKAGAYGGSNYNPNRGSISGRGRGGFEANRSGSQGTGRGGFTGQPRGRGGPAGGARGGRGASQPTNA